MQTARAFLALTLLATGSSFAGEEMPADLKAYIEEIRAAGMTEDAAGSIRMVAAIEAGSTILEITLDDKGKVDGHHFRTALCPKPGMSEEARAELRKQMDAMAAKVKNEMARLRPLADRDGSGFVSTEEGARLRDLYEMGKGVLVITADGLRDGDQVAEKLQMPVDKLQQDLAAYAEIKAFAPLPALTFSGSAR